VEPKAERPAPLRTLLLLGLTLAMVAAGCSSPPPANPGNTSGQGAGSGGSGNGTASGGGFGFGNATIPPAGSGAGNGSVDWHNAANPILVWQTNKGTFKAELFLDKTPITAGNFLNLTKQGFYDGTRFHRVIANFMIQDGDPLSKDKAQQARWGTGGPGYDIKDEFPCKDGTTSYDHASVRGVTPCTGHGGLLFMHNTKGLLSMANAGPNSGGSQYFVTVAQTPHLDGKHAIFGRVVEGYDVVEAISKVPTSGRPSDRPLEDVVIERLTVA
jgi:cyclophilin family peptidyl-prolyl cis-trans isomerase